MLKELEKTIEKNIITFATVMSNNKPNAIAVGYVKVISDSEMIITDNFMKQTIKDIQKNNNVVLLVWNKDFSGYKIIGKAKYFVTGKWLEFVKKMKENKGLPAKGAILVKVLKIIPSR